MSTGLLFTLAAGLPAEVAAQILFRDVAEQSGLDFILENSPTESKHLIETMAGGVAVFDYDGDGRIDIYLTNGAAIPSLRKESPKHWNRLYRNQGGMRFRDVTQTAGLAGAGYSIGAAAADYDNDGDPDLFVTGVRGDTLYRNRGDGTFEDVSAKAGVAGGEWASDAAWIDYDHDGLLDLFVVRYLQWTLDFDTYCGDRQSGVRAYCHPRLFAGLPNALYRNRGDGTFEDVSEVSGISAHVGKGMSAAVADYDLDGFDDIFVTNDKAPNFLFHNLGDGAFEEVGLFAGPALRDHGKPASGMGADFRDYDDDGLPDIVFTALFGESFPLFRNAGDGLFDDASYRSRLAPLTIGLSGWSVGLYDFDNDGRKDLFTANAHVNDTVESFEATRYKLPNSVFLNQGDGVFEDGSATAALSAGPPRAHRGSGFADFNGDGWIDVVVTSLGEPVELWENVSGGDNRWLILRLRGRESNRDAIGARIRIGPQRNHMTTSVGYASSSRTGVHFGLGDLEVVERIDIRWPSGVEQTLTGVETNRRIDVTEPRR